MHQYSGFCRISSCDAQVVSPLRLPPFDLQRVAPWDPVGFVPGVAKHQGIGVLPSRGEGQDFLQGFIDGGSHREEPGPAGSDTKRRRSDIEMGQGDDGIDGCDRVALRDMGDHEMRSTPADRIKATIPCRDEGRDIPAQGMVAVQKCFHPPDRQPGELLDFPGIMHNQPLDRLPVSTGCCVPGNIKYPGNGILINGFGVKCRTDRRFFRYTLRSVDERDPAPAGIGTFSSGRKLRVIACEGQDTSQ